MAEEPQIGAADEEPAASNMFASVWVKVEVDYHSNDGSDDNTSKVTHNETPFVEEKQKKKKSRKVLKCHLCDYTSIYKNCLDIHIMGHTGARPFVCNLCPYTTKHSTSLNRHVMIKHQLAGDSGQSTCQIYKCDQCDYNTHFKWNLNSHKRKHKLEKQFKCSHCEYSTAYRHNYIKHSKVHNKHEEIFKCDKCPFETKYKGHIERHLAKIHHEIMASANICDLCGFSTKERWRLNIHKQRSFKQDVIKCIYCDFESYFTCESKKHKSSHYSEIYGNGRVINCSTLNEEVKAMIAANENKTDSIDDDAETGESMNETYQEGHVSDTLMDSHAEAHHYTLDPDCVDWNTIEVLESDDKDKPFQCHMCTYTSKFKASVQRHFQRHHTGTQNRPYKCRNCDFSTKTKDQIALHNKRSQSHKIMYCRICKFTSHFKCQYVLHQKRHYTHKCTICNYSCRHKYELTKHVATLHLGGGLKCQYCDYTAWRKESILCHETIHTGIKPFKCGFCDYSSVRKSLLDNHLKRYHVIDRSPLTVVSDDKIKSLKVNLEEKKETSLPELNNGDDIKGVVVLEDNNSQMTNS